MRLELSFALVVAAALVAPPPAVAQGIVVDQGRFAVSIRGASAGTEDFSIRRAGLGREEAFFANASVALTREGLAQEIRPLLRATPPEGVANEYQVEVVGADALELGLRRIGRRFVATIHSEAGEEQREFPAEPETWILEADVAHLYYFLRNASEGSVTPVVVPRARVRIELTAGPSRNEELRLGSTALAARRVEFSSSEDRRIVWFDPSGRVLRVEIPATGYVAERTDAPR
jgi:hypothetical protein